MATIAQRLAKLALLMDVRSREETPQILAYDMQFLRALLPDGPPMEEGERPDHYFTRAKAALCRGLPCD